MENAGYIIGAIGVVLALLTLVNGYTRGSKSDLEAVRKEFAPQIDGLRQEYGSKFESIATKFESVWARFESARTERDAKLEAMEARASDARHTGVQAITNRMGILENDLRHLRDEALTKSEGNEMERRILERFNEMKAEIRDLNVKANKSQEMLTKISVKVGAGGVGD